MKEQEELKKEEVTTSVEDLLKENEALKAEIEKLKEDLKLQKSLKEYANQDLEKAKEYLKVIGVTVVSLTRGYV